MVLCGHGICSKTSNAKTTVLAFVQQNEMLKFLQPATPCPDSVRSAVQIASTTSCNVTTCGTGNNYLAAVSFNYAAGISFNNTATAAQRAFSSGAFQVRTYAWDKQASFICLTCLPCQPAACAH